LGAVAGSGGQQVTENRAPLYRFSGDQAAGATNGDGINSFGGTWHVVKVGTGGGATGSTSPSTGSSGY
jgi:hypothetical protein